jgi:drug/metabolite transporter (DMT)-like permease
MERPENLATSWRTPPMTSSVGLHFKTYCMILIMVVFAPLGNVLLAKGMKNVGSASSWTAGEIPHIFVNVFTSTYIWLGVASLLTFFVAYMLILSWADYSYVQPASSVAYLVVALLGYFYLGESISRLHWLGIAVICLGVLVVGQTPPRTTETP